jgi:hypothetical protein
VVIEVLTKSSLTNKQLCAITLGCEKQSDFPVFSWNVTFPDKPKPTPRPPQPPAVSENSNHRYLDLSLSYFSRDHPN